mgnify:FL=1
MKKGFTLVELIVVIVLLSLISIFTFPSINKVINERKEKLYNIQIENIKASAESYINKNNLFSTNDKVIVTLCELKQSGFTDENIKDPRTGLLISDNSMVIALKNTNEYTFMPGLDSTTSCSVNDSILYEYIEVGSEYILKNDDSKYTITIYLNNEEVDSVDTSEINTYVIKYVSSNETINKYVYIIDTTGPNIEYVNEQTYRDKNGYEESSKKIGEGTIYISASQNSTFVPFLATAIDKGEGETTLEITSNVNLKIPGIYYITYSSKDSKGNATTKNQTIKVYDDVVPVIDNISGIPNGKTSNSIVLTVDVHDNESGLHSRGAYSFDGGATWQVSDTINVTENKTLNIVVRDAALNETRRTVTINNILKDDKTLSFNIKKGTMKNSGWYVDNVEVEIKPLVNEEDFSSYSYCISSNTNCPPNKEIRTINGTTEVISQSTTGLYICGYVTKKDGTRTSQVCSMNIKIDKELPTCTIEYQSNYDISLGLPGKIIVKDSISGAATNPIPFLLKSSKTYEIYDKAGNRNTCEVKVKVTLQHRYKTCAGYKSCANADYCGRNTYSCNCSDCKYGSNTCRGGCNRSKCSRYYCCSNLAGTRCKSLSRPGNYKYCSCTDYKCTDWDSCKYGSNTCSYGCDTCQGDAKSCANPTCGCASYSYSEWTLGACTNVPGKTCETRGGYLKGD